MTDEFHPKSRQMQTERLILREKSPEYYAHVFENLRPSEQLEFLGIKDQNQLLEERERHEKGHATWRISFKVWDLVEKQSQTVLGYCGYHTWFLYHRRAELGYEIFDKRFRKKGYMKEALERVLAFGFDKMNLQRIEAFVVPGNLPSEKLLDHFGFVKEGIARKRFQADGVFCDNTAFSLLRNEE